ncbi:XdhC/CoxI family protein [Myxococcota bacterium]|nr:XdhC/CoxI family protein [Myxococcota bacterium]
MSAHARRPFPMIDVYRELARLAEAGEPAALATVIEVRGSCPQAAGSKMLVRTDGSIVGTVGGGAFEQRVIETALGVVASGTPERVRLHLTRDLAMCCGGTMEAFVEPVAGPPALLVFGAGHVGAALAMVATVAGFRVTVVDEREEFARSERLRGAHRVVCAAPTDVLDELPWGEGTFAVIVTHEHSLDEDLLWRCAGRSWRYLGMIGSRRKVLRFRERFIARGGDPARWDRVHAPIGLDVGAVEPGEIAVAVAAELVAVLRGAGGRPASSLRLPPGGAHPEEEGADAGE